MKVAFLAAWALLTNTSAPHRASVVSSLVKVRPGQIPSGADNAQLSAARGECASFQVFVPPPVEGIQLSASPLVGPGAPLSVRPYREEWIEIKTPSNAEGAPGPWPDPLIPVVDAYANERRDDVAADSASPRPAVFYIESCVPASQQPGGYRGTARLTADHRDPQVVEIALQVQPFAIPATSSLPNTFGLSLLSIGRGHHLAPDTPEAAALLRLYARALLAHRVSAHGLSMRPPQLSLRGNEPILDFSSYDQEMAGFFEGRELPSGARFTTAEARESSAKLTDGQKSAYYAAIERHFHQKKWPVLLFYYAKDEPKPDELPIVDAQAHRVHQAGRIPVLVTAPYSENWKGIADILCPNLNCFFSRPGAATCSSVFSAEALRRLLKSQVWWYQSCSSHGCGANPKPTSEQQAYSGWASYMVDHPATLNRAMGPLAFLEGVDGELYFDTVFAYNRKNPWEDLYEFGGNGDGTLFYPGIPARIGGQSHIPIESLRLKHLRDGLVDFEYLQLLRQLGDEAFAKRSVRRLVRSGYDIERDVRVWEQTRSEMTSRLAVLWRKRMADTP